MMDSQEGGGSANAFMPPLGLFGGPNAGLGPAAQLSPYLNVDPAYLNAQVNQLATMERAYSGHSLSL